MVISVPTYPSPPEAESSSISKVLLEKRLKGQGPNEAISFQRFGEAGLPTCSSTLAVWLILLELFNFLDIAYETNIF